MSSLSASPSRKHAPKMFDRIAPRYDLLNHLLSFNRDKVWRKRLTDLLGKKNDLSVLDLATGTGDQLLALYETGQVAFGLGVDPSEGMLAIAKKKITDRALGDKLKVQTGTGENIPAESDSVDTVTISFGIRNVVELEKSLSEIYRVLKPGGQVLILEFSLPSNIFIRTGYLFYFRYILPLLGGMISGDNDAYRYLNKTVESFPYGEKFARIMRLVGFSNAKVYPLTFGVASIYSGLKEKE